MIRCRWNPNLLCGILYKKGKGAWDMGSCQGCTKFPSGQQVFVKNINKGIKMSLKDIEKGASSRLDLDKLPPTIRALATDATWVEDDKNRTCLVVNWKSGDSQFTQKYTPMHLMTLAEAMNEIGITDLTTAGTLKLKKTDFRIGFPRMIPTAKAK